MDGACLKRSEAAALLLFALLAVSAGVTWLFGAWALVVAGAVAGVAAFALEVRD